MIKSFDMEHLQATDREQGLRLLEAGIDPDSADMSLLNKSTGEWELCHQPYRSFNSHSEQWCCPAWSMSRLMALAPKERECKGKMYRLRITWAKARKWSLSYSFQMRSGTLHLGCPVITENPIEGLVTLLIRNNSLTPQSQLTNE